MNVEYLNPVIKASTFVISQTCGITPSIGKPYLTQTDYDHEVFIVMLGITGRLHGQVMLVMNVKTACDIASKMMMGMEVNELNDMARSALGELMNMMMGNAMTNFSEMGILLDITPPTMMKTKSINLNVSNSQMICVPIDYNGDTIELNIAVKENE